ncbi:unnamed protein product [Angiostrongylus costaricensis]|uniref:Coronin n=1 Tax=Angiostrongylus costaricensis TaxID=334426 RepID=A0A158PD33_ANGCS|nr:unnamed protein product [Angiostrongylus costaricensis]
MAWRFQASKFKNTTPHVPKKEVVFFDVFIYDTVFDLPIGNLCCSNNGIQASASYLAFHVEGEGGKLGALPIGTKGRKLRKDISLLCAHSDQVDDFCFMTFDDDLLVTCSRDDSMKIWHLSGEMATPFLRCEVCIGHGVLLDAMKPHTTASNLIAATSLSNAFIIDIEHKSVIVDGFSDKGYSLDWSEDGKLLAISADKGRQICIYDVRSGTSPLQKLDVHQGLGRESRVLFCGDRLLSSGFTSKRTQEVIVFDVGKWDKPIHTQEYVSTTGILMPLYDSDTRLVFLVGKGTNKLFIAEFQSKVPYLSPVYEMSMAEQNLGACLGSKRCVTVMDGEVDTLYQLTRHSIVPVPCIVPRRSYRDFHADLFPATRGPKAGCTSDEWLTGSDALPAKISLAPSTSNSKSCASPSLRTTSAENCLPQVTEKGVSISNPESVVKPVSRLRTQDMLEHSEVSGQSLSARVRPKSCVVGQVASKFRHVELKANGAVFTNLRNVNTQLPLETNGACASGKFIAVPLKGPAGIVGVYDVKKPEKLPDGVMDGIFNKALVTDLHWNPFDDEELAVGTDVGLINFWHLTTDDGPRNEMQAEKVLNMGGNKVLCFQWHPMASDLLAVALSDNSIEICESKTLVQLFDASSLHEIHTQQIDSGTQPLVPYYDYDSSVLFLSGKGSRIINMYEVCYDPPYLLPLTPYVSPCIGQAIAFHNKKMCDVMAVEFQRAWRLSEKTIEQLIFRVPRVKKDVFQSDLFPDALVTWRPVMTADEWLAGSTKTPHFESLKPDGVSAEDIWSAKIKDHTIEQDVMEGVSEEEWTEAL